MYELWRGCLCIVRVKGERVGVMVRVSEYIKSEGWVL